MLADPFLAHVDVPSGAETTAPFSWISVQSQGSVRENLTAADGEPKIMKISHSVVGKGALARDRHLARLESYVVEDSVEDQTRPIALYMVADVPQSGVTTAQLQDLWAQFVGLVRGASSDTAYDGDQTEFFDAWLSGQS